MSPHSYFNRPLSSLYPIKCPTKGNDDVGKESKDKQNIQTNEIRSDTVDVPTHNEDDEEIGENIINSEDDLNSISSTRPTRKATIAARKKIKEWLNPEESMFFVWGVLRTAKTMM